MQSPRPARFVLVVALMVGLTLAAQFGASASADETASSVALAAYNRMTPRERVGQLFIIGVSASGASSHELSQLAADKAGNVYLTGRSGAGRTRTAKVVAKARSRTTVHGTRPWVGVDQEGGEVQVLSGPGFDRIPTALAQGRLPGSRLYAHSRRWAGQLRAAGVNLDLAPVADTVPRHVGTRNQPIGRYDREYGYRTARVRSHVGPFVDGLRAGGVAATVKHFPGLGRASANTDDTARVTDPTTRDDSYLTPFRTGIRHGAQFVMVSSAIYPHLDPRHRACFSATIIQGLLRGTEGFRGIVVSDSFGARSVAYLSTGQRAVRFFGAGGTMVLDSSAAQLHPMARAVLVRMTASVAFARTIRADVLLVLAAKARAGFID